MTDSGVDPSGLGRWSWYLLEGEEGFRSRVISAYAPCGSAASKEETYYQQQARYITEKGLRDTNPKKMFREDLLAQLRKWRAKGDRIVLMMDANEDVVDGVMCRQLREEDINLREVVFAHTQTKGPKTYFRGKDAIDGIWVSEEVETSAAAYLPFDPELGDHRPVVANISKRSLLGTQGPRIKPPAARRLNSKVKRIRQKYIDRLEELFKKHRVLEKLIELEAGAEKEELSTEAREALENLDKLITELMANAESKCRKKYKADYDFSPEVRLWIEKGRALRAIIRLKLGRECNVGNVKRTAKRCGITNPLSFTKKELWEMYYECKRQCKKLLAESPWLRKMFLSQKLQSALDEGKDQEANEIKAIIRGENQRRTWRAIDQGLGKVRSPAPTMVETEGDTGRAQHRTKEGVESAIHEELDARFDRASSAPICNGPLFELLGYNADTKAGMEILEGTFIPPKGTDPATVIILNEIARIYKLMGEGEVSIIITKEDFQHYWKRVKERTASSYSGRHFGHYKSAAHSDYLSEVHARHTALITKTGATPSRWSKGLSVMLEKIAGVAVVTKLRAILLMEADFNFHNKLIFGNCMMKPAREHGLVPEEIYSEKGKTPEDAILQQVLVYDIARQLRRPLMVASVDAAQCYDRIAHAIAALTLRAFKVPQSSASSMLEPIQNMEYYLRTGFGESTTHSGGKDNKKQGTCQGNTAAPPTWQQISTLLVNAQRHSGHGIDIVSPISGTKQNQVGILFVDDTNLWAGLGEDDDAASTLAKGQDSITSWGNNLLAVGGELRPDKCMYTLHEMRPTGDGEWEYVQERTTNETQASASENDAVADGLWEANATPDDQEQTEATITVPLINGDAAAIKRLTAQESEKNLGLRVQPDGDCATQLKAKKEQVEDWTTRVKTGHLPARAVWQSYSQQLWSSLKYGLGTCSASLEELEGGLGKTDFYLLSRMGVARSIPTELRYMPHQYCGMELNHLPVEATIAQINSLLQHYGTTGALGTTLTAAIEHLQVEVGCTGCPLNLDYQKFGHLATDTWAKSLWEKIHTNKIEVSLDYKKLKQPRGAADKCLMETWVRNSHLTESELRGLNRVRKHQQATFLSDITTAKGDKLDQTYLSDWKESHEGGSGRKRSKTTFGREIPTKADWLVWQRELSRWHTPTFRLLSPMDRWVNPTARIWRYFYDEDKDEIQVKSDRGLEIYPRDSGRRRQYRYSHNDDEEQPSGIPATATENDDGTLRIRDTGPGLAERENVTHSTFVEHLNSYGGEWFWNDLRTPDGTDWIAEAMKRGTLTCVTDGSYMQNLNTEVCGAGWIIRDTITGQRVSGSLAEWSTSAGSYRGELLGMLAIRVFLLAVESFYGATAPEHINNRVSCDNKSALFTFEKKSKRVTSSSSNADVRRALREVNKLTTNKYQLEHVKGHQDRCKKKKYLTLEARLNIKCDEMAKEAV